MKSIKICKVPNRTCWIIFITAQVSIMAFMIATFSVPNWVKLHPTNYPVYNFTGGLLKLTDGLSAIPNPFIPILTANVSGMVFTKVGCSSNFVIDILGNQTTLNTPVWNLYSSWGTLFNNLWFSGGLFLVFELTALICIVIIIVTLSLFFYDRYYFNLNFCASGCMWASHVIAIIGWLGWNKITFSDGCNDLNDGTDPPTVCALDGPILGIFVLIYSTVVMVPYFVVIILFVSKIKENVEIVTEVKTSRVDPDKGDMVKLNQ